MQDSEGLVAQYSEHAVVEPGNCKGLVQGINNIIAQKNAAIKFIAAHKSC